MPELSSCAARIRYWSTNTVGALPTKHFFQGIVPQLRLFDAAQHEYPNLPAYLIFDAQYMKKYSFANRPIGSAVPQTVSRAATLLDLASKLGIDGEQLEKTARRFNGFVESGADEDFQRGDHQWKLASVNTAQGINGSLGTIAEPAFFGIELRPAGGSSVGLLADVHGRSTSGVTRSRAFMPPALLQPSPSKVSATRPAFLSLRR
jgi:hypothetical protein